MAAPAPSHAERSRTLVESARTATLATLARDPKGFPYASLVAVAFDPAGRPLLLLSSLAEHTQNLLTRPEASLLVHALVEAGKDPLAEGRLTLLGSCRPVPGPEEGAARERFLERHPEAKGYASFKDFSLFRLEPTALRYVGGFGRMSWIDPAAYLEARPDPVALLERGVLDHMNEDHAAALVDYARGLAGIEAATAATMTAVDRLGFEMRVETPEGPQSCRLGFDAPVATADEIRRAMITLLRRARGTEQG